MFVGSTAMAFVALVIYVPEAPKWVLSLCVSLKTVITIHNWNRHYADYTYRTVDGNFE